MEKEEIQVVLYGKVVNCSKWAGSHPGGDAILKSFHNRDATDQFEAMHSPEAKQQLEKYFLPKSPSVSSVLSSKSKTPIVRSFTVSESQTSLWAAPNTSLQETEQSLYVEENEISKDFQALKKTLEEKGLFKANVAMEFFTAFYTLSMYVLGGYLIVFTPYLYTGLFCMLQALYMSGWVAHDYLHHSVLPSVYWNEIVGGFFGMLQGYDGQWWKLRHNLHHVNTNECAHDPDISIAPLFHFVQQFPDLKTRLNSFQKYQHYYFLPFLTLLDADWRYESITHAMSLYPKSKLPVIKLLAHYIVALYIAYFIGVWGSIGLILTRGFLTAVVVFSNHYSEKRYVSSPALSFVEQTAYTTRNISGGFLVDFFTGHISLQLEHHLFPTMPPSNLALTTPYVKEFLKKHNLPLAKLKNKNGFLEAN
eukprot:Phypoly_transcript_08837.p1 GENE.Phypoly_transcript_08837~~Phypoly_transcript_08837.p1  ORF type:complete len:455 (+),score=83.90 Phypoly_transcript_08837:106-1365(+)